MKTKASRPEGVPRGWVSLGTLSGFALQMLLKDMPMLLVDEGNPQGPTVFVHHSNRMKAQKWLKRNTRAVVEKGTVAPPM